MSTNQSGTRAKKRFRLRGPLLLACIPLALFTICLIAVVIHERFAADRVQAELRRIQAAGYPVDNATLSRWFIDNTSSEGTKEWHEILRLADAGTGSYVDLDHLPYMGHAPVPNEITSPEEWAEEAEVAAYLQQMRPVIDKIDEATKHPTPVWQPIHFQGFGTFLEELQESRQIIRLLSLDVEHALHHRDAERALRSLDSMQAAADAFDWPFCLVSELVQIALRGVHQSMVRRSMEVDIWSEEQLRQLAEQLGPPREFHQRWRDTIAGERAMLWSSITSDEIWKYSDVGVGSQAGMQWLLRLPSTRERLLQFYREMEDVGAGGIDESTDRAGELGLRWSTDMRDSHAMLTIPGRLYELFLPAIRAFAAAVEREESSRRFSLTAVAIKRFQLQEGRWPNDLTELEQVGLGPRDWRTVSGGRFGYEIDGDEVYLWSYQPHEEERVALARPPLILKETEPNPAVMVIR